jgi:hypothetical protein
VVTASTHACSVERKCTGHGVACASSDRACLDKARADGLEIACERPSDEGGTLFVYCPPGATARDSSAVWILFAVAVGVAVVGALVALIVWGRKKKA